MFETVLEHVNDIHIKPHSVDDLTLAGLKRLERIDPAASIERHGDEIQLLINGTAISTARAGTADDPVGWAATVEHLIIEGRNVSGALQATDNEKLFKTVIDGIVGELDRYSRYADRKAARQQREDREGFGGVGISILGDEDGARIQRVTKDMPANRNDVRVGDIITAADGDALKGMPLGKIVRLLRGPVGTNVTLSLRRDGQESPLVRTLVRARVIPITVFFENHGNIGYLRMSGFNQDTTRELSEGIAQAQREIGARLKGVVIDLRGNPGGLLDQAVDSADLFLAGGRISSTRGRHPDSQQIFDATHSTIADGIPVVMLLDGASASASEVLAAALQDTGRAVLVGSRSFGKGTVQTVLQMPNAGELILTWARLLSPSGYVLHRLGVVPTVCTSSADDENDADAILQRALDEGESRRQISMRRMVDDNDPKAVKAVAALCPWQPHSGKDVDIEVAKRLLETPGLYQKALRTTTLNAGS